MNFTREPIIETIITPKDGYKLVVRNSKGGSQEEYHVDAVEVVSFGHSFFFRSLERPKSFFVPVSDYEIIETKETRVVLKNVNIERSIKIGGGRQEPTRKESIPEETAAGAEEAAIETSSETPQFSKNERKRERRRHRRSRRAQEERLATSETQKETPQPAVEMAAEGGGANDETQVSSSMFTSLFPPPPTLISETIARYKDKNVEPAKGDLLPEPVVERKKRKREEEGSAAEGIAPSDAHLHPVNEEEDSDYFLI